MKDANAQTVYLPRKVKLMEKEFSSIAVLAESVQTGVKNLEAGNMTLEDLETLSSQAAELHERLAVLKYKAYDQLVKGESITDSSSEEQASTIKISVPKNQINLMDVIEEEEKKEEPVDEPSSNGEFSFSIEEEEIEAAIEEVPLAAPKKPQTPAKPEPEESGELPGSLAEKLGKTAIADLKKSIGLNQKFQIISTLFNGDNSGYDSFVEQINSSSNLENAMQSFNQKKSQLDWDEEDKTYLQLLELVERRHL